MDQDDDTVPAALRRGRETIQAATLNLEERPGVYRMIEESGGILYVGKAKSLRRRVKSYTLVSRLPLRLQRMVSRTAAMEFIYTETETEALLLEANLIKKHKPPFNILLRDDKSLPFILVTGDHDYPQIVKHRGPRRRKGYYFGPFAGAGDVNQTLADLQKIFMLRNCSDNVFAGRTRPCLQYHIKRCTAPCVGLATREQYAAQVAQARAFLEGKSREIQDQMLAAMEEASAGMEYEEAARYRDRIRALTAIQSRQVINVRHVEDADVVGLFHENGRTCIQVFFFRNGQNFGNKAYFPRHDPDESREAVISAFLAQFYAGKSVPPEIYVSDMPLEANLIEEALAGAAEVPGRRLQILHPQRGAKAELVQFAVRNAADALRRNVAAQENERKALEDMAAALGLEETPGRVEIYDNSHISGTDMVGIMVVAGPEGFRRNAYRKFNIRKAGASDDYGMMREVMRRRFERAIKEGKGPGTEDWPGLLLIDGGAGQLGAVHEVLADLGVDEALDVVSIAKGEDRNAGREKFFMRGREPFQLPHNSPVLHHLQRLRDEAHRFAIGAHRTRRDMKIPGSPLDEIPGIGARRKKALLRHFGSGQAVGQAGLADLEQVEGISRALARQIYDHFH